MKYCRASVVLPGGCGTMDELFEALTLGAGRWGEVKDLVGPLLFLASPAADFVNGHILYVDGGMLSVL